MELALAPGIVGAPDELPVVEAWAKSTHDGLRVPGTLAVAEAIISEAKRLRKHPALAVVLGLESPLKSKSREPAVAGSGRVR